MYSGTGLYSLRTAARLIQAPSRNLHRWLFGYHHNLKGPNGGRLRAFSPPLWKTQIDTREYDEDVIGFQDLLEARFVRAFIDHGIPLIVVRRCLESARAIYGVDYPFTTLKFKTDGRTIFGEALRLMQSEGEMVDLRSRQIVFRDIIHPSLYAGIEYKGMQAMKWYPLGKRTHVVLDPARQFGKPIVEDAGIPTDALYASYLAEGGNEQAVSLTAEVFDVAPRFVQSAIVFETSLLAARA
ncbi:DUF433 domain-containing protein [Achromobacter aloeverae]|uniref:DUF433 domain-containing protein n=2 Tax=Achromobacter aloeverae TaxID=1750518 RepID=A0A4Q1HEM7_9BURK|nr:DUF433 domain-containing protein [Achromobacter aloeverae]